MQPTKCELSDMRIWLVLKILTRNIIKLKPTATINKEKNSINSPTRSPCECSATVTEAVYIIQLETSLNQLQPLFWSPLFVESFCSVTAVFFPRRFPFVFPFKFASVAAYQSIQWKMRKSSFIKLTGWLLK